MLVATVLCGVFEGLAQYADEGGKLPWHLTASACLLIVTVLGAVSKSVLANAPPSALAPEVEKDTKALFDQIKESK
jgi:hypothetical protein